MKELKIGERVMATYRIVDMYRRSKAIKGIHYDSWNEPILAYRVDKSKRITILYE